LGVSVGIGTIVFLVSLGYGLQHLLIERITTSDSLLSLDVFPIDSEVSHITPEDLDGFKNIPHVKSVASVAVLPAQMSIRNNRGEEEIADATGRVVDPVYFDLSGIKTIKGGFYGKDERDGVVISSVLAEVFGWTPEDAIGKKVSLTTFYTNGKPLQQVVVQDAFASTTSVSSGEADAHAYDVVVRGVVAGDAALIYIPLGIYRDIPATYNAEAKVRVESADFMEPVRSEIVKRNFTVIALFDVVEQANKVFKALQVILFVFGAAALLVSAIGMFNTMTIAFLERTQEIGIMRALGGSKRDIFAMFLVESGLMGFLGGVGGIMIGFIAQFIVGVGVNLLARTFNAPPVALFDTPFWFVATIIIFSTGVGFLTGIFPGRRASKLNPLEALRYK
jgi:putative ABC transport system permease protein